MNGERLESDIMFLCHRAEELGASQAIPLPAKDVVVDERVLLKCIAPLCAHYGRDFLCPPNVLPVSRFKEILERYHRTILIKVDIPSASQVNSPGGKEGKQSQLPREKHEDSFKTSKMKLYEIIGQLEATCLEKGYYLAAGLVAGSCSLCEECVGVGSGLPCRHPFQARPSMEAMGIDVLATAEKAGLHLDFAQDMGRSWIGLLLVD
jgi:predicted metal-binding protein